MIQVSIQKIEQQGLQTELDYERALLIERKLRIMAKTEPNYDQWRQRLRNCIEAYEDIHWSLSNEVDEKKMYAVIRRNQSLSRKESLSN